MQALALLVHVALRALPSPVVFLEFEDECTSALRDTVSLWCEPHPTLFAPMIASQRELSWRHGQLSACAHNRGCLIPQWLLQVRELMEGEPGMGHSRQAMRMVASLCSLVLRALRGCDHPAVLGDLAMLTSHPQHAALTHLSFVCVEQHTASFDPAMTAADLLRLSSLLQLHLASQLIKKGAEGQMLSQLEGTALAAVRQLRGMGAGRDAASLHRRTSDVLSGAHKLQEALPEQRAALRLATADKGEAAACTA